ncbi:MAG: immunoglobulin domain-containing protein [Verrucomicrobiota bacterium]
MADPGHHKIRKITSDGVVSTLAGSGDYGSVDGPGSTASFSYPSGVAADGLGNVYVTDSNKIRKITSNGVVSTLAGSGDYGSVDGPGSTASFSYPSGVAADGLGNVYVTDSNKIRKITSDGVVSTLAGSEYPGSSDGPSSTASFSEPTGVAVDGLGNVYVADPGNNKIRKITSSGMVSTLAGSGTEGSDDGPSSTASFSRPANVAVDGLGNVYVGDLVNNKIRKITSDGAVSTLAGAGHGSDGPGSTASFNGPVGVAADGLGNVYVADPGNHKIRKITSSGVVSTLAGAGVAGAADATGTAASFNGPVGVAADGLGNVYVADYNKIRKITSDGVVSTLAGSGDYGSVDGPGSTASFSNPYGVAVDGLGNVYVADYNNHKIRKITSDGAVSTLAGSGDYGSADGPGSTASFSYPRGVAADGLGNVYVADYNKIRKITSAGVVSTVAGSGDYGSVDGPGSTASFSNPYGVAVDGLGNVYVADFNKIRKITSSGVVSTLAGSGNAGDADGPGSSASFHQPKGVAVDGLGNVYVADSGNNKIRKMTSWTDVSTARSPVYTIDAASIADIGNYECVVTDQSGSVAVSAAAYLTVDSTPPVLSNVPENISVIATSESGATVPFGAVTALDNVDGVVAVTYSVAIGTTFPIGTTPVTVSATDALGNTATSTFPVTVFPQAPVIKTQPQSVSVVAGGSVTLTAGATGTGTLKYQWRKVAPIALTSNFAGKGTDANGPALQSTFLLPWGVAVDGLGNVYVADSDNNKIRKITSSGVVSTLAGSGASGAADGPGSTASFRKPYGVAVDGLGNVYVADTDNNKIRKITSAGVVSTLAGAGAYGSANGSGSTASFSIPSGVAVDGLGNVYVVDTGNNKIRKITSSGVVSTLAGSGASGAANGPGSTASFGRPEGVAVDGLGNVYVADTENHKIRKITGAGVVSTLAGSGDYGSADGPGSTASFSYLSGVTVDGLGNVYVADTDNYKIRKITSAGVVSTLAGADGAADGPGSTASFSRLYGVAVDGLGNVYVADTENNKIRKITSAGVVSTFAGADGAADGPGSTASFSSPYGVAVDGLGNVYVADTENHKIRKITSSGVVSTLAGFGVNGAADGPGSTASFSYPIGICMDGLGSVYVADSGNHKIRKITSSGVVSTFAGSGANGAADGPGSTASFSSPYGVAVDGLGNVYVADYDNNKIRKITSSGLVSTLAGAGVAGSTDGPGSTASFDNPTGVAVDGLGNVYVADSLNHKIRKITSSGLVSTLAGAEANIDVNGIGLKTWLANPSGVAVDGLGNVYEADTKNNTIRKITTRTDIGTATTAVFTIGPVTMADFGSYECVVTDPFSSSVISKAAIIAIAAPKITASPLDVSVAVGGAIHLSVSATGSGVLSYQWRKAAVVSTFAGIAGTSGATNGSKASAKFNMPAYSVFDARGNLYVSEYEGHTIRKIAVDGTVSTFAGAAGQSGTANGTGGAARFNNPAGMAFDSFGNLFVADGSNHVIRKITPGGVVSTFAGTMGVSGGANGTGTAASFDGPTALVFDKSGNLYVGDDGNYAVRKITPSGVVTTYVGVIGDEGAMDGPLSVARLREPDALVFDSMGNLYIAETSFSTIRKVTPSGVVSTFAGKFGQPGSVDGIGVDARFGALDGIAIDGFDNLYVTNHDVDRDLKTVGLNATIRKITPSGVVTTIAGLPEGGEGSTDGIGNAARFKLPLGVTFDGNGNLYVNDALNHTIRKIALGGEITGEASSLYTVALAKAADAGTYECVVTDSALPGVGVASEAAKVTVSTPGPVPKISTHPVGGTVLVGGSIKLSVSATSTTPVSYLWSKDGNTLSGGTAATYTLIPTSTLESGSYSCVVSNTNGGTQSKSAIVTVTLPPLPVVKSQPVGGTLQPNGSIKLSVTATSPVPLTYQWQKGGTVIPGANSPTYTVAASATEPAGKYDCLVKNAAGEVATSAAAVLLPQMLTFAQPAPVTYGCDPILLGGSASSGSPLSYKVVSGSATVSGSTLTITGAGSVVLKVSQTGDATHVAAADVSKTLVVAKKTLTVSAGSKTRIVGAANPAFALTYSGFSNGDTEAVLDKKPTVTTTATTSSAEGSYPVTISGGSDNNYTLVYSTGATLLVTGFGGSYEALLMDSDHTPIGKLELTVPLNSMAYSGKLTLTTEAKAVTLVGILQPNSDGTTGASTLTLTRKDLPTLTLNVSVGGGALVTTLRRGELPELASGTTGTRLYTVPAKGSAPWAGTYTMVFREPTSSDVQKRDYPHGANYASVVIAPATGILTFTGKLADGTAISGGLKPDPKGGYRLLIFGSRWNTYLSGQLSLMAHPDTGRFPNSFYIPSSSEESFLVWANVGDAKDNSYRAGFGPVNYRVSLDPWHAPVTGSKTVTAHTLGQQLGLVSGGTESATISVDYGPDSIDLGALGASLPTAVSMAPGGVVSVPVTATLPVNVTKWMISVTPTTGVFTGSFSLVDVVTSLATRHTRNVTFSGILRQGPAGETSVGNGYFMLPALPSATTPEQQSLEIQFSAPAK